MTVFPRRFFTVLRYVLAALVAVSLSGATGCGAEVRDQPPEIAPVETAEPPIEATSPAAPEPQPTAPSLRPTDAQAMARDDWLASAFLPGPSDVSDVIRAFGEPERQTKAAEANPYVAGQMDTVLVMEYDQGLTVHFYNVTGGPELMVQAEVTAPGLLRDDRVDVGSLWSAVVAAFGPPQGRLDGDSYYQSGRGIGPEEPVFFTVEDDVVSTIRFTFYVG